MSKYFLLTFLLSTSGFAAQLSNPSCSELKTIKEKYTPSYLAVIDGYNKAGKKIDTEIDMAGFVTDTNGTIQNCQKEKDAKISAAKNGMNPASPKVDSQHSKLNPSTAKCEDYIALGEEYQPIAIAWVAGHTKAGKIKNGEVEEEYLEKPTATFLQECKSQPKASFYDKAKSWLKKHS